MSPVRSTTYPYDPGMSTTFAEPTLGRGRPRRIQSHPRRLAALRRRRHGRRPSHRQLRRHDRRHRAGRPAPGLPRGALGMGRAGWLCGRATTWWRCGVKRTPRPWRSSTPPTSGSSSPTISTWRRRIARHRPTSPPSSAPPSRQVDPTSVFFPMGLANPDHVMVHDACLLVRLEQPDREWFCYEDHGYKHLPGMLAWRVAKLLRAHPWPTPAIVPHVPDEERKRRAIWCYTSQIAPLEQDHALTSPHGGPRTRAVLAARRAAGRVGRAVRLDLGPGAKRGRKTVTFSPIEPPSEGADTFVRRGHVQRPPHTGPGHGCRTVQVRRPVADRARRLPGQAARDGSRRPRLRRRWPGSSPTTAR